MDFRLYDIYRMVKRKLTKKFEEKKILDRTQFRFRKGKGLVRRNLCANGTN